MGCRRATLRNVFAASAAAAMIAGCAGNGNGLDSNGRPLTGGSVGPDAPLADDFDSIQEHIFTPICSVCHVGGSAPQGLRLDAANSYALTVGVPSTEVPAIDRIKPGDPDNSYLIQKLEGHAAVGAQMPFGGPYLSSDTIAVIRQWITEGAPASVSASANGAASPLALTSIAPGDQETQTQPVPQLMLAVNHELDLSRLDASVVRLERLEPAGGVADVPTQIRSAHAAAYSFLVWPKSPLVPGHYRLRIAAGAIQDLGGEHLGEVHSAFDVEIAP